MLRDVIFAIIDIEKYIELCHSTRRVNFRLSVCLSVQWITELKLRHLDKNTRIPRQPLDVNIVNKQNRTLRRLQNTVNQKNFKCCNDIIS